MLLKFYDGQHRREVPQNASQLEKILAKMKVVITKRKTAEGVPRVATYVCLAHGALVQSADNACAVYLSASLGPDAMHNKFKQMHHVLSWTATKYCRGSYSELQICWEIVHRPSFKSHAHNILSAHVP